VWGGEGVGNGFFVCACVCCAVQKMSERVLDYSGRVTIMFEALSKVFFQLDLSRVRDTISYSLNSYL
jgi:hypothetical protein